MDVNDGSDFEDGDASIGGASGGLERACEALFGEYTVLAPGVQIVLDGRPVSCSFD